MTFLFSPFCKIRNKNSSYFFLISALLFLYTPLVWAASEDNFDSQERPIYHPPRDQAGSVSPWLKAPLESLDAQKLTRSSFPEEAELFCGTRSCVLGLTRGLVVGGDVAGIVYAPMRQFLDPYWVSGSSLYIVDVFGGVQILRDENTKSFMNAQIGYRRLNFDDGSNIIATQGVTTQVNYSQSITTLYSQGLEFSAYFVLGNAELNNVLALNTNSANHQKLNNSAGYFYRLSQSYPTYQVSLPADLEIMNWGMAQTDLPMPIHAYLEVRPFYIQNNLNFSGNTVSLQKQEQNFGVRFAALTSYESSAEKSVAGRYALKTALGMDISTSNFSTISLGNTDLDLPKRSLVSPYVEVAGSFQF